MYLQDGKEAVADVHPQDGQWAGAEVQQPKNNNLQPKINN
jgi:hypothetical protein